MAVLHTWTQRLEHHPHIHCVVPAGGLSQNEHRWIPCRKKFFLPVKPLGRLFRRKLLTHLEVAFGRRKLEFHGRLRDLAHPVVFADLISSLRDRDWVVYAKPPFGTPEQVLRYVARYTHRIAISNGRLVRVQDGRVYLKWRDSRDGNQIKETSLDAVEFIRRFLLHVLPSGFVKIRHFGFLSNRNRRAMIHRCRELLPALRTTIRAIAPRERICPICDIGHIHVVDWCNSPPRWLSSRPEVEPVAYCDTS